MRAWIIGGVMVALVIGAGLYLDCSSVAAEGGVRGPQELMVRELKQIRDDLKDVRSRVASIEDELQKLNRKTDLLLKAKWEYRTETVFGGDSRTKLTAILAKMGREKFEYAGQTSEGLYIFKRRIIEDE